MLFGDGAEAVPGNKSEGKGKKEAAVKKVKGAKDHLYKI